MTLRTLKAALSSQLSKYFAPPPPPRPTPPPPPPPVKSNDDDPSYSARYLPYEPDQTHWIVRKQPPPTDLAEDGLPVPPQTLWAGYCDNPRDYLDTGVGHHRAMMATIAESGYTLRKGDRVFELGCAAGRILRNFHAVAGDLEIWGADLSARHVQWCQQHLGPARFFTNTTFPHLPFEDNSLGLIYAASVFTHIGDLEDAWLMELRRVLRPGGRLYITVHDNHTIELLLNSPPGHWLHDSSIRRDLLAFHERTRFKETGFDLFLTSRAAGNTQVFHDLDYIKRLWGGFFQILSVTPEGSGYQTAITMTK